MIDSPLPPLRVGKEWFSSPGRRDATLSREVWADDAGNCSPSQQGLFYLFL